jgi:hypothetical protein
VRLKAFVPFFIATLCALPAVGQTLAKPSTTYDMAAETTVGGVITSVVSMASAEGTVGVHFVVKTADGKTVKVHAGPAMFIGMNNFSFLVDERVAVIGALLLRDGDTALLARAITKDGQTLVLRSSDGTPRWPSATADDQDGCGVAHAPVRY